MSTAAGLINIERVPVLAEVDLVVVGAGSAGCCAAIAAAERGVNTLLIERYGFAGGSSTGVLDTFYCFFTLGDAPRKIVGGIPGRVVDRLVDHAAAYLRPNTYGAGAGVTYNPELLKIIWDELLAAAGVRVLLHSLLIDVECGATGVVSRLVLATRGGLRRVRAKRFIDASGDAELCHLAGIGYERAGDIDPAQTPTTTFRLSNVDQRRFESAGGKKMLAEKMASVDLDRYPLPRRKGSFHAMAIPGCASTVAARIADIDPMDSEQLSFAESLGRRQALAYETFVREQVPGYGGARLSGLSTFIGIRETRRVYGENRLTRDDCMSVRRFDDCVLLCGAPIEDHRAGKNGEDETVGACVPDSAAYDVPYRALVAKGRDEVWVVGRWSAPRTMPTPAAAAWRKPWRGARLPARPRRWRGGWTAPRATCRSARCVTSCAGAARCSKLPPRLPTSATTDGAPTDERPFRPYRTRRCRSRHAARMRRARTRVDRRKPRHDDVPCVPP
jgi:hypothetical protein